MKTLIFTLIITSFNALSADYVTTNKAFETAVALEQYKLCLDEIDLQYSDESNVTPNDIEEMNKECQDNYEADLELIKKAVKH